MNILLTNIWISNYGGTEVYIRDLSVYLYKNGHGVEVYSPNLGQVAREIASNGINIVDSIEGLVNTPDLIHAQHYTPTLDVISKFPGVPVVYFLHDRIHLIDNPPRYSRIKKYVAVDYNCLDKLTIDNNINKEKTTVIYNWVDTSVFKLRTKFAKKPRRALVFSNNTSFDGFFKTIKEACDELNIEVHGIGIHFGNSHSSPEKILHNYDIVFAKAKCAMEGIATGAAVILCDKTGLGQLVTTDNIDQCRRFNFGMKLLTKPITKDKLIVEINKYNSDESQKVTDKLRNDATLESAMIKIIKLYHEIIDNDIDSNNRILDEKDQRLISDYLGLKEVIINSKIRQTEEKYKEHIKNFTLANETLMKSIDYRLGRVIIYPLRTIYHFFRRNNK